MSQLTSLNQTQQSASGVQTAERQANKISPVKVTVDITTSLKAEFKLAGQTNTIFQQLTAAQANKLANQSLLAVINQQAALIFLQSQKSTFSQLIPTNLLALTTSWLEQNKALNGKLPQELAKLLTAKTGLTSEQLQVQLLSASLKQSMLSLSFLSGEAITELKLDLTPPRLTQQELANVFQLLLPLPLDQDNSYAVLERSPQNTETDEDPLKFEMRFELEQLGHLTVQVELNEFELNTRYICDNKSLVDKINQFKPQFEQRLSGLGFQCQSQLRLEPKLNSKPNHKPAGLINIKV